VEQAFRPAAKLLGVRLEPLRYLRAGDVHLLCASGEIYRNKLVIVTKFVLANHLGG
jgi:hypothetical protein